LNNGNSAEMVTVRPQGRQRECGQTRTRQMTNAKTSTRQEKWQVPKQLMRQLERQHLEIPCVSWCLITPFNIGLWNNVPTTRDLPSVKDSLVSCQNWAWKSLRWLKQNTKLNSFLDLRVLNPSITKHYLQARVWFRLLSVSPDPSSHST
jgi:hypothetical protein